MDARQQEDGRCGTECYHTTLQGTRARRRRVEMIARIPRAADSWLERGGETRCRDLRRGPDDLVAEDAQALDLGFHAVPGLEEVARRGSHTVGSPGRDDVSRQEAQALGQHLDALRDGEHHLGRVALLANLAVDAE